MLLEKEYDKSQGQYVIDQQCPDTLNIIMRSIFTNSCNLETTHKTNNYIK